MSTFKSYEDLQHMQQQALMYSSRAFILFMQHCLCSNHTDSGDRKNVTFYIDFKILSNKK